MNQNHVPGQLDIRRITQEFWNYRYYLIVSLIIAFGIAIIYMKFASETYKVQSIILINTKIENTYSNTNDLMNVYDILERDVNLQNEIRVLQSSNLIKKTLNEMGLEVSYYIQEDKLPKTLSFSLTDIYTESPIMIIMDRNHAQPINTLFYVKILNDKEFQIAAEQNEVWLYNYNTESYNKQIDEFNFGGKFRFGDDIQHDHFSFKMLLNSNFDPAKYLGKDLFFRFNNMNDLVKVYQNSLSVESISLEATTAEVNFVGDNIQKSIDFVNGIIAKYIEETLNDKNYLASNTIQYIDKQLTNISDTLNVTENQLQNFRRSYNIMNVDEQSERIYIQLHSLETERDDVNRQLSLLHQMRDYFESNKNTSTIIIPSSMGINDPLLNSLIQELITLNSEKEQMIRNNQIRNPRLQTLNSSIENFTNSISENLNFSINTTTSELQVINNKIATLNDEFARLPQTQRKLLGIERKFDLTQGVFTSLMEKRIQAEIAKASTLPDCKVIEPAYFINIASPKKIISFVIAIFLGLFFPTSYILLRRYFSDIITEKDDLNRYCSLKHIGYIPEQKKNSENVMLDSPSEVISESIRSLRSNIDFFLLGEKNKIILVTSTLPQEGKSFTALNLATSFAQANSKTLLIRFDLRKSEDIYNGFKHKELIGITNYLINRATLEDVIISTEITNLDLITSGEPSPNPLELITSEKVKDLLSQVKQRYDFIILDTPPFGLVSDAFILMKFADISLFMARLSLITSKALSSTMSEILEK
ncbi:GumC family protein, partial [Bacteroidota bacterium]